VLLALALVVFGLAFPAMAGIREAANRTQSQNNLKQLSLGTIDCSDANFGKLPPAFEGWYPTGKPVQSGGFGSCLFHVLPYIGEDPRYMSSRTQSVKLSVFGNWRCEGKPVTPFIGPGDPTNSADSDRSSYLANGGLLRRGGSKYPASIPDGTSQTIFYTECYSVATDTFSSAGKSHTWKTERRWWSNPAWIPAQGAAPCQFAPSKETASANLPQGFTSAGINVGLGDGSVRFVSSAVSAETFYAACTPAANDILGSDW
jgi:hypothetical protein